MLGQGLANGLFNLALGGNPERLEELADAGIENVLVHDWLLVTRSKRLLQIWRIIREPEAYHIG